MTITPNTMTTVATSALENSLQLVIIREANGGESCLKNARNDATNQCTVPCAPLVGAAFSRENNTAPAVGRTITCPWTISSSTFRR